jgi:hypothetical protein
VEYPIISTNLVTVSPRYPKTILETHQQGYKIVLETIQPIWRIFPICKTVSNIFSHLAAVSRRKKWTNHKIGKFVDLYWIFQRYPILLLRTASKNKNGHQTLMVTSKNSKTRSGSFFGPELSIQNKKGTTKSRATVPLKGLSHEIF